MCCLTADLLKFQNMEKFTFFWTKYSPFSNWYPSEFNIDGVKYCCNEQYYMQKKAKFFGDKKIAAKIMETDNPAVMKRLGKSVKGFDGSKWRTVCRKIMMNGLFAKVSRPM